LMKRDEAAPTGPVMRYHGGKWRIGRWVIDHFPAHRVYVEPYCGAASVLMQKPRSQAEIINDLDSEIVNVFRVLREPEQAARLAEVCALTPYARAEFALSYEASEDPVEQARRTILRGFLAHSTRGTSGQHRTGFRDADQGNVVGPRVWGRYPEHVMTWCRRLAGVVIENRPALEVMARFDAVREGPETLWYLDPPYVYGTRGANADWKRSYRHEMTDEDHRELAAVARALRGMVLISGYPSALYDELYGDWTRVERKSWADGQRARVECLWISPRANERLVGRLEL